jgi:hypothetical protein
VTIDPPCRRMMHNSEIGWLAVELPHHALPVDVPSDATRIHVHPTICKITVCWEGVADGLSSGSRR